MTVKMAGNLLRLPAYPAPLLVFHRLTDFLTE